jgi:hypothetical protein
MTEIGLRRTNNWNARQRGPAEGDLDRVPGVSEGEGYVS